MCFAVCSYRPRSRRNASVRACAKCALADRSFPVACVLEASWSAALLYILFCFPYGPQKNMARCRGPAAQARIPASHRHAPGGHCTPRGTSALNMQPQRGLLIRRKLARSTATAEGEVSSRGTKKIWAHYRKIEGEDPKLESPIKK